MTFTICVLLVMLLIFSACATFAAIHPLEKPAMVVVVDAGEYTVRGQNVNVNATTHLRIDSPDRVQVKSEEQILSESKPNAYIGGTSLRKTLGPIDKSTRMLWAIDPASVRVHSTEDGGTVYEEGKDYFLDHDWGGMSRIGTGSIAKGQKVYIDYDVRDERVDVIQVSSEGNVSVKKGRSAPVCAAIPDPDPGCTALAAVYVPYQAASITGYNIRTSPVKNITWHDFVKVSGKEYLSHTLGLLKENKPVTVVCWGDSVTEGSSPSSHDKCYVELFRARLKAAYPKSNITLINAGIGGSNTDSRRNGYEKEVLSYNPDLITVEFVNDTGKSPEKIAANWHEFIARAREKNPNVEFILITPHFTTPAWMRGYKESVDAMRKAAVDNKVALADASNIWANLGSVGFPYEILLANVLNHPNDLGHEFFTASLMQLMQPGK